MTKQLSLPDKRKFLTLLIERDGGYSCFYCKKSLEYNNSIFDHLNNDRRDNRLDNLVLACQSCNVKKIHDRKLMDMAEIKLDENEQGIFVGEKFLKRLDSEDEKNPEPSKEIDINVTNFEITESYIEQTIERNGSIHYSEALHSCVYLCKKKAGHGSQQSIRNYLGSLTSPVAPFTIIRDKDRRKVIVRRKECK